MTFTVAALSFGSLTVMAQDGAVKHPATGTGIPKFAKDRSITKADIGFLNMITEVKKSRGAKPVTAKVDNTEFKVGQKLTEADATSIANKITAFTATHAPDKDAASKVKTRGSTTSCWPNCTCWWRDIYGYWYWYCCYC